MATTTNYSWTTPDDTALVKDGAAAIRSLGTAIDTTVFTNAGAAIAKSLIDAEGDLIVGDAADAVQRLAVGSNGNVLTVDTTVDGKIKWAAPAGGGKVLQVVQDTETTGVSSSTSSYVDTGLSVSITPSSATSKVLVFVNGTCTKTADNVNTRLEIRLQRDATTAQEIHTSHFYTHSTPIRFRGMFNSAYLDSPATTSAITYKVQINAGGSHSSVTACDIGTSTIIAMEIGA
jgi:hypothetical protein